MPCRWKSRVSFLRTNQQLIRILHTRTQFSKQSSCPWQWCANYNDSAVSFSNGQAGVVGTLETSSIISPLGLLHAKDNVSVNVPLDGGPTSSSWCCISFSFAGMMLGGPRWKVRMGSVFFLWRVKESLWNQIFLGSRLTQHNLMQYAELLLHSETRIQRGGRKERWQGLLRRETSRSLE